MRLQQTLTCWRSATSQTTPRIARTLVSDVHVRWQKVLPHTSAGAWCIVSSPLILGLDLTDEDRVTGVWDIITNRDAIAVNQNWAGSPGKLVKIFNNSAAPPVLPQPGSFVLGLSCDETDGTQVGWYYDNATMAVVGPMRNCLDAVKASQLTVAPCTQSPTQQFVHQGADNPICLMSDTTQCLDISDPGPEGPKVQMYRYHGGSNEKFTFEAETLHDGNQYCLAVRSSVPTPEEAIVAELWAKPQPNDQMAVLVITNMESSQSNQTFTIEFADLGLSGEYEVSDIWQHRSLGSFSERFVTDAFGGHDSRFYMLKA